MATRARKTAAEYTKVFFNRQRLHRALGCLSPTEPEDVVAFWQAA